MIFQDVPISYYKRFRMEVDVQETPPPAPVLPPEYSLVPWHDSLLDDHAEIKYQSFFEEIDAVIFANLSCREGCLRLMHEISGKPGFVPQATWLVASEGRFCGTIQGVRERSGIGAIQNVGVVPSHRGRGLGEVLVLQALHGFRQAGIPRVHLEVTAQNEGAIRLYRRLGFRCRKTLYKTADVLAAAHASSSSGWFT